MFHWNIDRVSTVDAMHTVFYVTEIALVGLIAISMKRALTQMRAKIRNSLRSVSGPPTTLDNVTDVSHKPKKRRNSSLSLY